MTKAKDLTWNVFSNSFNNNEIETYNVFHHYSFSEYIDKHIKNYKKAIKKEGLTKKDQKELFNALKEQIRSELMYYFWSKFEWEIGITEPFSDHIEKGDKNYPWLKTDVFNQVSINYDLFFDYIYRSLVKKEKLNEA